MQTVPSGREQTLYVEGMHCSSCEIIIEKKFLKKEGVLSVDASLKDGEVRLVMDPATQIDVTALNGELEQLGYRLSNKKNIRKVEPLFTTDADGTKRLNQKKAAQYLKNIAFAGALLIAFIVVEKAQLGRFISIDQSATFSAFLILGLIASVSSCAALIGGVLLSLSKHWHEQYGYIADKKVQLKPHLMFHGGRLGAFFVFGGVLGLIGDAVSFDNSAVYALFVIGISIVMFIIALQMLGVSWAQRFAIRMPKAFTRMAAKETTSPSFVMPFIAGAMTFFLPCGFTLIAQGAALASGEAITGAYIMTFFAIGTLPVLAGISFSGVKFTSRPHLAAKFSMVAGVLILFFALYNVNGQLNVLGLPSMSDVAFLKQGNAPTMDDAVGQDEEGVQKIYIVAKEFDYIPTSGTTITANVPTKIVVDNQGILGCGAFMASNGLINGFFKLERGENVIDVGKPKAGSYKLTCSMGMVPPVTITVI